MKKYRKKKANRAKCYQLLNLGIRHMDIYCTFNILLMLKIFYNKIFRRLDTFFRDILV